MAQRVLLHACCGPCSIAPALRLRQEGFEVTALFVNPNIHPLSEYLRRREAMKECAQRLKLTVMWRDDLWNLTHWLRDVAGGDEPRDTGEARCTYCYATRLQVTAQMAVEHRFDFFCSSLLYSRYQRHESIAREAAAQSKKYGIAFLYADFRDEWQKGIDISKEWNVYRQPYCGCVYSEAERYEKKLKKIVLGA